jgi:hypothetical protein
VQNIFDIHDFDENFLEQFTTQTIPIYDLWSIRPLQNDQKEIISGNSDEAEKFRDFISDHANQEFPHPLVIVIGNAEKGNSGRMSNTSKRYFKLKFEKFKGNDLGSPLTIAGAPQPYPENNQMPMSFMGIGQNGSSNPANPMQGFSLGDIHGIIDRNVSDATRSIKAEYQEQAARREAESIKRMAELETRMEMYKLEIRENEIAKKEQELQSQLEELEQKKLEGLGSVKDYTKTIAGGILEFGKVALGLDNDEHKEKPEAKTKTKTENLKGVAKIDDEGFQELEDENLNIKNENNFALVLQDIESMDEDQKMALLEAIIPSDENNSQINTDEESVEIKNDKLKIKDDEKLQTENTD